jgi:hypothetical protein
VEILIGEFLVGIVAAAVLVWGYSLFLLVTPDERQCVGGATAEFSGLEQLPHPLGDGNAEPCQRGFELAQTPVQPLEDGLQGDSHQSGMWSVECVLPAPRGCRD